MSSRCLQRVLSGSVAAPRGTRPPAAAMSTWRKPIPAASIVKDNVWQGFTSAVGNTPLIRLNEASEATGSEIWGKCEWNNPGGSVKDRAALYIIKRAEAQGVLTPGKPGVIVEGTAGNTGIGLTYAANARGYKTIIVIPETQSQEKKDTLRWAGAELLEVPAVPFKNPNNFVHLAQRLAEKLQSERENVLYADQWDNPANKQAHFETTGPEIWAQTQGKVTAFSCATGTGGTLAGTGEYLRSKSKHVDIALTDPCGAAVYTYLTTGEVKAGEGSSITEGIGQGRITGNMSGFRPDLQFEITDTQALNQANDLMEHEGLCIGSSSAINVAGAIRVATELGPGQFVVTILCDLGTRYAGKMYNPQFLRSVNLPVPRWLDDEIPHMVPDIRGKLEDCFQNE